MKKPQIIMFIVLSLFFLIFSFNIQKVECQEIDIYMIPEQLQLIAKRYNVLQSLNEFKPDLRPSYLDLLTAADIVATRRAEIMNKKKSDEDWEIALAATCRPVPWDRPKPPKKKEEFLSKAKAVFSGCYLYRATQQKIRDNLDLQVLGLPVTELRQKVHPIEIFSNLLR